MMGRNDAVTKDSKRLSWLLRHGAHESGIRMDTAGWVTVDDVLRTLSISRDRLDRAVRDNNKSRLQVAGDRIRACQGHSLAGTPVTLEGLEGSWERHESDEVIWHGTGVDATESIAREGILPVARTHVHLAEEEDSKVGKRAGVDVLLGVMPSLLRAQGILVFKSPNGVLLARRVPPECIGDLRVMTSRARGMESTLRARFRLRA